MFTNCSTTLPGDPASKKRHHSDVGMYIPNIIVYPNVCKIYYNNYYDTDIRNHFNLVKLNLESYIKTSY